MLQNPVLRLGRLRALALLAALVASAGPAATTAASTASNWLGRTAAGTALRLQLDGEQLSALRLDGRPVEASLAPVPGGSGVLRGRVVLGRDAVSLLLTAPGADGARTLHLGAEPVELRPDAAGPAGPASGEEPAKTLRLRPHVFRDAGMRNMPSHHVLVPEGWSVEGGALWLTRYFALMPTHQIKLTSPDGLEISISGPLSFQDWRSDGRFGGRTPPPWSVSERGLPILPLPEGHDGWSGFLTDHLRQEKPAAAGVAVQVQHFAPFHQQLVPSLQKSAADTQRQNQENAHLGMNSYSGGEGLAYQADFRLDGRDRRSYGFFSHEYVGFTQPGSLNTYWTLHPGVTFTGPADLLDENMELLCSLALTFREDPAWVRMREEHRAKIMGGQAKHAEEIRSIWADTHRHVTANQQAAHDNRVAVGDELHRRTVNALTSVETYTDTHGHDVNLPPGFERAYQEPGGAFLLVDDPLFDPAVEDPTGNWTRIRSRDR